jgi:serine/threonine protein kinase
MPPTDHDPEPIGQGAEVDPLVGRSIDKYRILGVVGRGGMGAVYEALNTTINKRVAMKCIDTSLADNPEATARFQREAMAASAVESPHIVQIFDAGVTAEGTPYIVMELLRGRDLGKCIAALGRLELGDALHVVAQVLRGLGHAHAAGIIHRDLKPDNVFLVEREDEPTHVKILDFGVSKFPSTQEIPLKTLTRQGTIVGTPYYMAPEQAQGFPDIDLRADIYSVGAILYECLAGRPPHVGQAYEQVIVAICMRDAEDVRTHNPSVPEPIARVLGKALSRERSDRYATARELLEALLEHATDELRGKYQSVQSGMHRLSTGSAPRDAVSVEPGGVPSAPDTMPMGGVGAPTDGEALSPAVQSGLANTVRADSGIMSVAPPSEPPALPLHEGRRRLFLRLAVGAGLAAAVGLVLAGVLGGSGSAPAGGSPATAASATATLGGAASSGCIAARPEPEHRQRSD